MCRGDAVVSEGNGATNILREKLTFRCVSSKTFPDLIWGGGGVNVKTLVHFSCLLHAKSGLSWAQMVLQRYMLQIKGNKG